MIKQGIKPGVTVTVVVKTPVATTEEPNIVERFADGKIYLKGLDEPFDSKTGKKESYIPGCSVYIKELSQQKDELKVRRAFTAGRSKTSWEQFKKDNDL